MKAEESLKTQLQPIPRLNSYVAHMTNEPAARCSADAAEHTAHGCLHPIGSLRADGATVKRTRPLVAFGAAITMVATGCLTTPGGRKLPVRPKSTTSTTSTSSTTQAGSSASPGPTVASFALTSPTMTSGGAMPTEYTCDGASNSPALQWTGTPTGTKGFALAMHHVAGPSDVHWYWTMYDMAATVNHLDAGSTPPATVGTNSVNHQLAYAPPCSKGPGAKQYTITIYALDTSPRLTNASLVTREVLLSAINGHVLAESHLDVTYTRTATAP
jgi:phosphatidylethanolamine-binding protein (PEBP) family uncharacterized protein